MRRFVAWALVGIVSRSAFAAGAFEATTDFSGADVPAGWTVANGVYRSPGYSNAVDRIVLRYAGADASASATVQAFSANEEGVNIATFTAVSTGASFDFPDTTDFRSFLITTANGLALSSFSAFVSAGSLDAPTGVAISNNITGTSFDASWNVVNGATGYRVYVWTNAFVGVSAGTAVWQEIMPGATNASSSTKLTDAKFNACFENVGWTRSDKAGYPTGEDGTIRIGTSGEPGWIQTPAISHAADGMAVRFRAKANVTNTKSMDVAIERVSGETVTLVEAVTLTTDMQEFMVALPDWESGDCIRFNSITNVDRRTTIGTVTVVAGYSEGQLEPSYIVDGLDVGAATSHSFADLPSVPVQFAVEAYGRRGVTSGMSGTAEVDLSNPDKVAVLNACPLSSHMDSEHAYTQNFDSLATLTSTSSGVQWLNGTTLQYWQAYCNGGPVGTLKWNSGSGTTGGLYALATNQSFVVRALGARATTDKEYSWGIAFTNDTEQTIVLTSVGYSAQQWGFGNKTNQTLSLSVQVADGLNWISAYSDGWMTLHETESVVYGENVAHDTPVSEAVSVSPDPTISIAPGQVLMLKWTAEKKSGTPGMMGIDDVNVTFEVQRSTKALVIRLANHAECPR